MYINIGVMVISVKMHLLTQWPWPFNPKAISFQGYIKVIPYIKSEQFGIICFQVMLQSNRQTDKQTDSNMLPALTGSVGMDNETRVSKEGAEVTMQGKLLQTASLKHAR